MQWVEDQKWRRWFAWRRVLIKGIIGESHPKIVWLKFVERRVKVDQILNYTYTTYEYRDITPRSTRTLPADGPKH